MGSDLGDALCLFIYFFKIYLFMYLFINFYLIKNEYFGEIYLNMDILERFKAQNPENLRKSQNL